MTLELVDVSKTYRVPGTGRVAAVDGVSVRLEPGRTLALVGQSGSGKSTIAKMLTLLERPTSGRLLLDGERPRSRGRGARAYRGRVQMVFQDPFASLNPYHSVGHHLERPLRIHRRVPAADVHARVIELLERVRLTPGDTFAARRPHELSGGQRQRVAIARALAAEPDYLVADEPVSMLDVSIRLGVLNLIADVQRQEGLGMLYITHDLATARHFSDEIAVMHQGRIVEQGPADDVILDPQHEYTRRLRDASPDPARHFAGGAA
ncbi:ABC transporter ATP-binding protein [Agrococcus jejuensis]|uniref:Peptide/nickel transport system ATP-binding protein n=1 Tax=Agrococcus jejuensis TaxID=399736 RepID=A0A1G8C760_9MICO|nr:ATP-binding cassette domain-containing protein [Agrococcus jejuensis]SDH41336.1 peptide/nickel transport system ATP-binding protein [Agrococcus jejuensis]